MYDNRAWRLNCGHACAFGRVDEAVSGGKPPAGKGVVGLLSWHGSHFWVCITFCKVRHGDSVTKPDYYYYYYYYNISNIKLWILKTLTVWPHRISTPSPVTNCRSFSDPLPFEWHTLWTTPWWIWCIVLWKFSDYSNIKI